MIAMISQPMGNKTNKEIEEERKELVEVLEEQGYDVLDTVLTADDVSKDDPICYLAKSLELLAEADILVCMSGWENARGCRIEHLVAEEYGKQIMEL